jgi:hypothetical protein
MVVCFVLIVVVANIAFYRFGKNAYVAVCTTHTY